jgi:hypothetical protein
MRKSVAVAEEITSPELVLVSPPELAALARAALPDYEVEFERWAERVRAELVVQQPPPQHAEPRFTVAALVFTVLSAVACAAPLVLLIAFR